MDVFLPTTVLKFLKTKVNKCLSLSLFESYSMSFCNFVWFFSLICHFITMLIRPDKILWAIRKNFVFDILPRVDRYFN